MIRKLFISIVFQVFLLGIDAPQNLEIIHESCTFQLTWDEVQDSTFLVYTIYQNSQYRGITGDPNFIDSDIYPGIDYCYYVTARDYYGIHSNPSNTVCSSTDCETEIELNIGNGPSYVAVWWEFPEILGTDPFEIIIYKDGVEYASVGGDEDYFIDSIGEYGNTYCYHLVAQYEIGIYLLTEEQCEIYLECNPLQGDVNWDGEINVLDILSTINCIMDIDSGNECNCADFNIDGSINILDIISLINEILY